MSGVSCLTCGAVVDHTEIGSVEVTETFGDNVVSPTDKPVQVTRNRYGTINQPCGCIDGGLNFDFGALA